MESEASLQVVLSRVILINAKGDSDVTLLRTAVFSSVNIGAFWLNRERTATQGYRSEATF